MANNLIYVARIIGKKSTHYYFVSGKVNAHPDTLTNELISGHGNTSSWILQNANNADFVCTGKETFPGCITSGVQQGEEFSSLFNYVNN